MSEKAESNSLETIAEPVADFFPGRFANFANFANSSYDGGETSSGAREELETQPNFPEDMYDNLPGKLRDWTSVFEDSREKDVFFISTMALLSGCLPTVYGEYDGKTVYPNFYLFVVGPPASKKGTMIYSRILFHSFHEHAKSNFEGNFVLIIPGNTSASRFMQHLYDNKGEGILFETEADTLNNALKQDWGNYSDILRKAFHHEPVSMSRKGDDVFIEINQPRLSLALSGTFNQVISLTPTSENGLLSRFIFYTLDSEDSWRDVSPAGKPISLMQYFREEAGELCKMLVGCMKPKTHVKLTDGQWQSYNNFFEHCLTHATTFYANGAQSIIKRMGLITFRFIMILTALRKMESDTASEEMVCSEVDFQTALNMADVLLVHSVNVFNNLPKRTEQTFSFAATSNKEAFFAELANEFSRSEAVELGKKYSLKPRTVDDFLAKLKDNGYISLVSYGSYKKDK